MGGARQVCDSDGSKPENCRPTIKERSEVRILAGIQRYRWPDRLQLCDRHEDQQVTPPECRRGLYQLAPDSRRSDALEQSERSAYFASRHSQGSRARLSNSGIDGQVLEVLYGRGSNSHHGRRENSQGAVCAVEVGFDFLSQPSRALDLNGKKDGGRSLWLFLGQFQMTSCIWSRCATVKMSRIDVRIRRSLSPAMMLRSFSRPIGGFTWSIREWASTTGPTGSLSANTSPQRPRTTRRGKRWAIATPSKRLSIGSLGKATVSSTESAMIGKLATLSACRSLRGIG